MPMTEIMAITRIRTNNLFSVERKILATKPATMNDMDMAACINKNVSTRLELFSILTTKDETIADANKSKVKIKNLLENKTLIPSVMILTI